MSDWDESTDGADFPSGELVGFEGNHTVDLTDPLSIEEARLLTDQIRSTADVLWVLISRAHAGRAWEPLGYGSFEAYVKEEFGLSRSRAYQLLNQSKVLAAIEAATPDGTELRITEAAARDIKGYLDEVVPTIESRTRDLPADEAGEVVEEIVGEYRERVREAREQASVDALDAQELAEQATDRAERAGFSDSSGGSFATPPPPPPAPPVVQPMYEEEDFDPAALRRNVQAAYDLYSSLSALKSMPGQEDVIATIPPERRVQVTEALPVAIAWLTQFSETWNAQAWQGGGAEAGPDEDLDDYGDEPI